VDESGNATGVLYYQDGELKEQKAKVVVLACNGIGTARLLLNSTSAIFPNGLANSSGLVGKCLMHHPVGSVLGVFDEWLGTDGGGPRGSTMLSQEFYETNPDHDFIRGYELQILSYGNAPLAAALGGLMGQKVAWGEDHHDEFKQRFGHSVGIAIMSEDLPEEHNMVTLDSEMTDSDGIPAPKINYTVSENTAKMLEHGVARATEIMEAAGATKVFSSTLRRNAGWHLLGTARMGEDPETSVVDRWGRTHDVSNLFIIDGSIFTTSACVNPTPTIQALALRTADYLKGEGGQVIQ